ncbi:superoxide dismutase family protein [Azospira restricta]|uniref:Superoxide dismutase [Cu-Zn] n=1 Tax=Azospira restricta TaxID=404405 RepID=A0A974SMV3_9RHOO|nr:superoxide dismutase family protein [Azospira restricta]QRJ62827.1 superoxide dismutase family protein [Azospira restricta]
MEKFLKIALLPLAAALAACATGPAPGPRAEATINPTQGNNASGYVSFRQDGAKLMVRADVSGLPPGAHGFHIHEKGDCSAADGSSAGGHFNPTAKAHGYPMHANHHAGDLPQLAANEKGNAWVEVTVDGLAVGGGGANDIVGKAVIVHAGPDDFSSQPAGNSGARVACGIIAAK